MVRFRNIQVTPEDPVAEWGFEGLLTAIERGGMRIWERIAAEVDRYPHGSVASLLEEEVIEAVSHPGVRELLRQIIGRARRRWEDEARAEVARRMRAVLQRSGLSQREFAARLGTSASRLNTYLNGKVMPGADVLIKAERLQVQGE